MNRTYKNLVFSKHALARLSDRTLTQDTVYQTVLLPDKTFPGKENTKFIRTVNNRRVHVVAAPIENHQWLVISAWVRGEDDRVPLTWRLITLPFRTIFIIGKKILRLVTKKRK